MEFFGISGSELLLILVVGVIVMGPRHAAQGILWLRQALHYLRRWSRKLREETAGAGKGLNVDLSEFDFAKYDPRYLVKEAVAEEMHLWMQALTQTPDGSGVAAGGNTSGAGESESLPGSLKLFESQLRALQESKSDASVATSPQCCSPSKSGHVSESSQAKELKSEENDSLSSRDQ